MNAVYIERPINGASAENYFQDVNNCLANLIQNVEMMRSDISEIKKKTLYTKLRTNLLTLDLLILKFEKNTL